MNVKQQVAKQIVEEHYEFLNWIRENSFDVSDFSEEEIYNTSGFDPIIKDPLELCEDNEAMQEAIKEYFSS